MNAHFIEDMEEPGLSDLTPERLVAMKILRVDRDFVEEMSGRSMDDISMRDVLRRRNRNRGYYNYSDEIWDALLEVVEDLTGR